MKKSKLEAKIRELEYANDTLTLIGLEIARRYKRLKKKYKKLKN